MKTYMLIMLMAAIAAMPHLNFGSWRAEEPDHAARRPPVDRPAVNARSTQAASSASHLSSGRATGAYAGFFVAVLNFSAAASAEIPIAP